MSLSNDSPYGSTERALKDSVEPTVLSRHARFTIRLYRESTESDVPDGWSRKQYVIHHTALQREH